MFKTLLGKWWVKLGLVMAALLVVLLDRAC